MIIEKYLKWLNENIPFIGGIDTSKHSTYKRASFLPSQTKMKDKDKEEEEVEEYTSYNPSGSGYGMVLQRWSGVGSGAQGSNSPVQSAPSSQKNVTSKIVVKLRDLKKKKKKRKRG